METKFNFNSQVCTDKVQSERLLALGLKKETADMHWAYHSVTATRYMVAHPCDGVGECIPAWSLHRLIEMMPEEIEFPISGMPKDFHFEIHRGLVRYYNGYVCCVMEGGGYYKGIIDCIEWLIKEGYFNKEYLI